MISGISLLLSLFILTITYMSRSKTIILEGEDKEKADKILRILSNMDDEYIFRYDRFGEFK